MGPGDRCGLYLPAHPQPHPSTQSDHEYRTIKLIHKGNDRCRAQPDLHQFDGTCLNTLGTVSTINTKSTAVNVR